MHGGDIYRQQVTYDFSVNINPIGLPDAVRQVMENSGDLAMQYPDPVSYTHLTLPTIRLV